ncbi:MAG TPA: DUF4395 domain-containing protein [Usitatibacter sp.]|nr:DUF4395 domain-containing protein [Usitatibacter sp.]
MERVLQFGERVDGYEVRVLNEREVRAAAGILFLFALVAFMNSWLKGDFFLTRVFVVAFMIDFTIRVLVNPRYAPSMIVGALFVRRQQQEYVGAPQKRFAWSVGLGLSVAMFFLLVVRQVVGPLNLAICLTCLTLLFFESAFGICIACKVYDLVSKEKAVACPGGVCATDARDDRRRFGVADLAILSVFVGAIAITSGVISTKPAAQAAASVADGRSGDGCKVPGWAVAIGHAEMWKLHNNCSSASH